MNNIVRPSVESLKLDDIILPPHLKPKAMQENTQGDETKAKKAREAKEIRQSPSSTSSPSPTLSTTIPTISWGQESSRGGFMRDFMDDEEEYYRVDEHEREELSAPILVKEATHKGLSLPQLRIGFVILGAVLLLAAPKVYLSSSIYYLSKEISALQTQNDMLHEQNKQLKHNVESLRYKYMILGN